MAEETAPEEGGRGGEEEIKEKALSHWNVKRFTEGKEIKRIIYVKGKLLNIVCV